MNIFEQAALKALRFPSPRGELTVEDLYHMPLQAKTGFDLDNVAKLVNTQLKSVTEESFVSTTTNPAKNLHELRLEIVKHIIAYKQAENAAKLDAAAKAAERIKLIGILGNKQDEALQALTPAELEAKIKALG